MAGLEQGPSSKVKNKLSVSQDYFYPVKKHFKVNRSNIDGFLQAHKFFSELQRWTRFSKMYLILSVYMLLASDYFAHINEY